MKRDDYIFSSMRIRYFEKKLLTKEFYNRLINAENFEDCLKYLSETIYNEFLGNSKNYLSALSEYLELRYSQFAEFLSDEHLLKFLSLPYEYHNKKLILKSRFLGVDNEGISYRFKNLNWDIEKYRLKNDSLLEDGLSDLGIKESIKRYEENKSIQDIDLLLDKYYLKELKLLSSTLNSKIIHNTILDYIDFLNVDILIRAKLQNRDAKFLEFAFSDEGNLKISDILSIYNSSFEDFYNIIKSTTSPKVSGAFEEFLNTNDPNEFEAKREEYLVNFAVDVSRDILYGPEVIYSYKIRLENEIRNLRIILGSKQLGLSSVDIGKRVRI